MLKIFLISLLTCFLTFGSLSVTAEDKLFDLSSVKALGPDATEEQMELVRQGAKISCSDIDDDDEKQQCVADYYLKYNLEEEPSCD